MTQLLNWFKTVFSGNSYGHDLDKFIASKHPTSVADVEHWTREYDKGFNWGRGL
jgi:hypothetical protein